ncbi:Altered inheritance of mitochondria protein 32 [Mycena chlorophos]|uniref:Altered inheritance of mitochondria protein 32 n=1 Tax=Mycena chlorophos TaxID=658473 RepID=A0A8H6WGE3_MYCCL|nr:Altered inheritance of mitochondria protein 32 [Mycena chlorophos]
MAGKLWSKIFSTEAELVLHGTVPYHRSYILLNAPTSPQSFPSRFSTPFQRSLQLQTTRWGGLVNHAWVGHADGEPSLTAFSALNGVLHLPLRSLEAERESDVLDIAERLHKHATVPGTYPQDDDKLHIYVCTHGARDCRCGDTGGAVLRALREELDARTRKEPNGKASRVVLGEVGHVGGHVFAANILVFPHGEWFGRLTPADIPEILDTILASRARPLNVTDAPLDPKFWRGRMGLHKEEQLDLMKSTSSY